MTEQDSTDKYIKCSRCKMKYHNKDDSIKEHVGYNRVGEQKKHVRNVWGNELNTIKTIKLKIKNTFKNMKI